MSAKYAIPFSFINIIAPTYLFKEAKILKQVLTNILRKYKKSFYVVCAMEIKLVRYKLKLKRCHLLLYLILTITMKMEI